MPRRGLDTERVLQAAVDLADEGLDRVTLARLAELLGVRAPSLYNHVDGRGALLRLIKLRGLQDLAEALATSAAGLAGEDALRACAHAYRAYARTHPGCYEAILAAPDPEDEEVSAAAERLIDLLAAILRGWHLEGEGEVVDAIRAVRSSLHGFVAIERGGGFALARDLDASFERLVEMLIAGLGSGRGAAAATFRA